MNFKFEDMENWEAPLPSIEEQKKIVEKLEKQRAIIEGADKIIDNFMVEYSFENCKQIPLGDFITLQRGHDLPILNFQEGKYPVVGSNGIIGFHSEYKAKGPGVVTGRSGTIGKVNYIESDFWPHNTSLFVSDFKGNFPKFVYYLLQTIDLKSLAEDTTAVPSLDRKNAHKIIINAPQYDLQKEITASIDKDIEKLNGIENFKLRSQQKMDMILSELWGEEKA